MKITNIEIENFLTIGKITANLDNKGLVLIQGSNDDDTSQSSNGAGKSSFSDSINWCIYGETARGATGDAVVNKTTGKQCRVAVTIQDGSQTYTVARHRKHKTGKNRLELTSDGNDLTKGTDKLTQVLVDRIVGCSSEVFNAAIYSGQEQMPDLPGMTDKFLKQIVEEAAGINEVQNAYEMASQRLAEARREHAEIESKKVGLDGQLLAAREAVSNAERHDAEWKKGRAEEIKRKKADYKLALSNLDRSELEANQAREELGKLESAKAAIQAKISGVDNEQQELRALSDSFIKAQYNAKNAKKLGEDFSQKRENVLKEIAGVQSMVGSPCSECGKPYCEDDIATRKTTLEERLGSVDASIVGTASVIENADKAVISAGNELNEYRVGMTDTTASVEKMQKIDAAMSPRLDVIRKYEIEKKSVAAAKTHLDALISETDSPYKASIETSKQFLTKVESGVAALWEKSEELKAALSVKQSVASVLSPAGVRAHILDTVTPFLNDRTARYLSALTDGNITAVWSTISLTAKGEARERFAIDVESAVGAKEFKGLSGGEKRKVRLATSMALQDLVASRATKPIDLYIADEIDDALDDSGLERLMAILTEKARERGTVLIISHNDLAAWITNSVTVRKRDGLSELEGCALA